MTQPKVLRLTLRRAALLHAMVHGSLPWMGIRPPDEYCLEGASEHKGKGRQPDRWILCCGHVYSADEIAAMEAAGWIGIGEGGRFGRRHTIPGPKIHDAWQWPHYG